MLGAFVLGARVFEKHFTDDNNRIGFNHKFAMNPQTWRKMVDRCTELYWALGEGIKGVRQMRSSLELYNRETYIFKETF